MNIFFVSPSWYPQFEYGGPIIAAHRLGIELVNHGHHVQAHSYWMKWRQWGDFLLYLKKAIPFQDVVYLMGVYNFSTLPTLWICRYYRTPLVWSPRGALQRWDGTRKRWLKSMLEAVCCWLAPSWTVFHCTSEQEAKETAAVFSWPIRVVPNGVDVPDEIRHVPASSPGLRLLYLGRIDRKKNLEVLIAVCTQLPVRLKIIGNGDPHYLTALKKMAHSYDHIIFEESMPHTRIGDAFADADLTVLASATENFGNSVAESLAHGVPVVASTACPWELEAHHCGVRVPVNALSMAAALCSFMNAPLQDMGHAGRAWMEKEFRWEERAKEMVAVFEYALSRQSEATSKNSGS